MIVIRFQWFIGLCNQIENVSYVYCVGIVENGTKNIVLIRTSLLFHTVFHERQVVWKLLR